MEENIVIDWGCCKAKDGDGVRDAVKPWMRMISGMLHSQSRTLMVRGMMGSQER